MEFEGTITFIGEETPVWQNNTLKQSFVLEENSDKQYKDSMCIDLFGEKTWLIKNYKVWDSIKVSLNFRAREYNWKRFNSIGAWRIDGAWSSSWSTSTSSKPKQEKKVDDDLPF